MKSNLVFIFIVISCFMINCEKEKITSPSSQLGPIANFSIDKVVLNIGEVVHFTNNSQRASSYSWDFGDGNSSTETNPTHSYTKSGSYTIVLTAKNDDKTTIFPQKLLVKEFTVMTYNIAFSGGAVPDLYEMWDGDGHGEWNHDRRPDLLKIIRSINPDILGLQEAFCWDSYDPPVYKNFADSLGMEYYYYPEREEAEWNGICIYSKYPIESTDFLLSQPCVPNQDQVVNGTYMVKVRLLIDGDRTVDVLVCHLGVGYIPGLITCEAETLSAYIISNFSPYTILMGDMNFADGPLGIEWSQLLIKANLRFLHSDTERTYPHQIDQIWATNNLYQQSKIYDLENIYELFDSDISDLLDKASDHFPVIGYLGFE
jgi:endonuclease/exonuclease/phosphatase family metal-dependent hydrolase